MAGFRHILFPVDFSERCAAIRPFVKSLAGPFQAKITLLHVFDKPADWYGASESTCQAVFDVTQMQEESCAMLQDFLPSDADCPFQISREARRGEDTSSAIVEFACQNQVDMIMLPTHGHGKFRRLLLGSVTSKILDSALCPVWTAAHTEDPALPEHANCRRVVVAVDIGSGHGLQQGLHELLRAKEIGSAFAGHPCVEVLEQAEHRPRNIIRTARERNPDLLILALARSKANEIIREVSCPVLTL